jgi:hypothetical protein
VSKSGVSLSNLDTPQKPGEHSPETIKQMASSLCLAFILGAKKQIVRFRDAYMKVATSPEIGTMYCLHEALTLLEDLDTIRRYAEMCGEKNALDETIRDMRNHARHDIRENLNHESNDGRRKRAKALGINEKLLVHIAYDENSIKMGNTVLTLDQATQYIDWATDVLSDIIGEGVKSGRIKGIELANET